MLGRVLGPHCAGPEFFCAQSCSGLYNRHPRSTNQERPSKPMNRKLRSLILPCLLFAVAANAQELVKPESVGLSSERLNRIAITVQRNIDDKRIAGAVTLVAR